MADPDLPRPVRPSGNPPRAFALAGVIALALLVQFGLARLEGLGARPLSGDEKRYVEVATAWAGGEPVALEALWPPGYPATLALLLRWAHSFGWIFTWQFAALLVAGGALAAAAREAGAEPAFAALAGTLLVVDPEIAVFVRLFWPEVLHLALFLTALALSLQLLPGRADAGRRAPWVRPILLGLALGGALALKSLLLPCVPLFLVPVWRSGPLRTRLARTLLVALPILAVLTPVLFFEHGRSGTWTLGGSARFNLWVGLTDRSPRSLVNDRAFDEYLEFERGGATFAGRQATLTGRLRGLVAARGLPALVAGQFPRQYFRLFDRESYFTAMLPPGGSRFLAGEGYRSPPPVLARLAGAGTVALYAAILALAPFGLVRLLRARRRGAFLVAGLVAYQLGLFWFVHVKARYRLTLLPLLLLGSVCTLQAVHRRRSPGELPIRAFEVALGGAGAAALLYFAFAAP